MVEAAALDYNLSNFVAFTSETVIDESEPNEAKEQNRGGWAGSELYFL